MAVLADSDCKVEGDPSLMAQCQECVSDCDCNCVDGD
jgi:hypothetical protein